MAAQAGVIEAVMPHSRWLRPDRGQLAVVLVWTGGCEPALSVMTERGLEFDWEPSGSIPAGFSGLGATVTRAGTSDEPISVSISALLCTDRKSVV